MVAAGAAVAAVVAPQKTGRPVADGGRGWLDRPSLKDDFTYYD
jgi:hypothetical protein